jgi:oligopeptidase B
MTAVTKIVPPRAAKRPRVETWHNRVKTDDYAWLRADNWQEVMHDPSVLAPEIRAHLDAENAYLEAELADTKALQERLFAEMKGRIKEDDSSVPAPEGAFAYYTSFVTGGQQPRFCRKPRDLQGPEQIMLDGNALSKGKAFFRFGDVSISPDQSLAAWSFDDKGSEFYRLQIRELASGSDRTETVDNTTGDASWASDGKSFFYTLQDDNNRPLKVFRHVLGTAQADDVLVYEE